MPHDKTGKVIEVGDTIQTEWGSEHKVIEVNPGTETCNIKYETIGQGYETAGKLLIVKKAGEA